MASKETLIDAFVFASIVAENGKYAGDGAPHLVRRNLAIL
jgi:hypothetical protein